MLQLCGMMPDSQLFRRRVLSKWFIVASLLAATAAQAEVLRLSEPVASDARSETFGAVATLQATPLTLGQLLADPARYSGETVKVQTRVGKVCQKKGCFFIAQDGAASLRVSFRDYGFFVPTDIGGRTVTLQGELVQRTLDNAQAAHYNADAATTELKAGAVFELVADSVTIPR